MAARRKKTVDGPIRHSSRRTKLYTRLPWKQRVKRKVIQRTYAEKKARSRAAKERKEDYRTAINAARQVVYQEAVILHAKFGAHSVEWYHKDLLQVSSQKATRGVSEWNVYLSDQAKLINSGTFLAYSN